jgi:beta-xylosidase
VPRERQFTARGLHSAIVHRNPIVAENCPDPAVIEVGERYYMVSTSHVLPAFPIRVSSDLEHWENTGRYIFTSENQPRWADDHFWAPEVHRTAGGFIAYYTARARRTNRLCIGAALAPTVLGPYEDLGRPLIEDRVSVLDATAFEDRDGSRYLYWKADAAPGDPSGPIYAQRVANDGLRLLGSRNVVLANDLAWEEPLIEGPWVHRRGDACYLFYSGGRYDTPGYAVGVARSRWPLGPFEKRGAAILGSGGRWNGPGHNSIASMGGRDFLVYHAWEGERFVDVRPALLDPLVWTEDGWPSVAGDTPSDFADTLGTG